MTLPVTLYGSTDCDDTQRTRASLRRLGINFNEVNIDHDPDGERFVIFVNSGYRSTPTLVIGAGKTKIILTEPEENALATILSDAKRWLLVDE